jgi:hypothetical protein
MIRLQLPTPRRRYPFSYGSLQFLISATPLGTSGFFDSAWRGADRDRYHRERDTVVETITGSNIPVKKKKKFVENMGKIYWPAAIFAAAKKIKWLTNRKNRSRF